MSAPEKLPWSVTIIFGLLPFVAGIFVLAAVFGYVPTAPSTDPTVPSWWLPVGGAIFFFWGLGFLILKFNQKVGGFFVLIAMILFVFIFNWVAFGPGERRFTSSAEINDYETSNSPVSETEGRAVFGLFAGAMDVIIIYAYFINRKKKLQEKNPKH